MRKLILLIAVLCGCVMAKAEMNNLPQPANNQIVYRSADHQKITPRVTDVFGATYDDAQNVYNTEADYGIITFDGNVTTIGERAFNNRVELTAIVWPNTVTSIGNYAFQYCEELSFINLQEGLTNIGVRAFHVDKMDEGFGMSELTIPSTVTSIGNLAFCGWQNLTKLTVKTGSIGESAFQYVGNGNETTTSLTLPEDWNYANAPTNNTTLWYGGYFNSNLYSEDEATDKQAAIDALTAILSDYSTSAYLQSLLAEEVAKINSAVNRTQVNERKQAAIDKLTFVVNNYVAGRTDGFAEGDVAGYQRAQDELPTDPEGTAGTAVTIIIRKENGDVYQP